MKLKQWGYFIAALFVGSVAFADSKGMERVKMLQEVECLRHRVMAEGVGVSLLPASYQQRAYQDLTLEQLRDLKSTLENVLAAHKRKSVLDSSLTSLQLDFEPTVERGSLMRSTADQTTTGRVAVPASTSVLEKLLRGAAPSAAKQVERLPLSQPARPAVEKLFGELVPELLSRHVHRRLSSLYLHSSENCAAWGILVFAPDFEHSPRALGQWVQGLPENHAPMVGRAGVVFVDEQNTALPGGETGRAYGLSGVVFVSPELKGRALAKAMERLPRSDRLEAVEMLRAELESQLGVGVALPIANRLGASVDDGYFETRSQLSASFKVLQELSKERKKFKEGVNQLEVRHSKTPELLVSGDTLILRGAVTRSMLGAYIQ